MEESTSMAENEAKVTYLDFEPYCAWLRDEETDTLAVHLPGFAKDQIKVQANNQRILEIHGQRPMIIDKIDTWTRFSKHVKIPENCNENTIIAKLVSGILTITMRKKVNFVTSAKVINDHQEMISTKESTDNNIKRGNCTIRRATDDCGNYSVRRFLALAGKVAVVIIVVAVSGTYVHACITKKPHCNNVEN